MIPGNEVFAWGFVGLMLHQPPALFGNRPIFLGADDQDAYGRITAGNVVILRRMSVFFRIKLEIQVSEVAQAAARISGEFSPIPAVNINASIPPNTAIIAPKAGSQAMDEDIEGKLSARIAFFHRCHDLTHVTRNPRDPQQA